MEIITIIAGVFGLLLAFYLRNTAVDGAKYYTYGNMSSEQIDLTVSNEAKFK